ncbi:aminomethyltransferase [Gracilaria domingensis]|nr:aminomethyltransferase [Gracilaria domingensis]
MPVQYPDGIKDSHLFVRSSAGLFDVSHMGQIVLHGADRTRFLERLVVADVAAIEPSRAQLSVITTPEGGIIDDTIISNLGDSIGMVINGACKDKDIAHIREHMQAANASGMDVSLQIIDDHELLALQGPSAMTVMSELVPDFDFVKMPFMSCAPMSVNGIPCHVTRCGYTGEDGFELSVPADKTIELFETLTGREDVRPTGLGARDSLRLEAGLCLYGNDIDETTSPVEAGLVWTIGKRRREEGGFLGAETILKHLNEGITRRRMAFVMPKGAPARGGETLLNEDGEQVGTVTSGGFSPSLGMAIGMGYANKPFNKSGTHLQVQVRSRVNPIEVKKMPLVPSNYYRVPE